MFVCLSVRAVALQCIPQRSALIKSILNFFKKIVPDTTFADEVRSCECHSPSAVCSCAKVTLWWWAVLCVLCLCLRLHVCTYFVNKQSVTSASAVHHSVLPNALKHIFSNGEYYGATLYLAGMVCVCVCVCVCVSGEKQLYLR